MNKHTLAAHELSGTWLIDQQAGHLLYNALLQHGAPDNAVLDVRAQLEIIDIEYVTARVPIDQPAPTTGLLVIRHEGMLASWDARWIERQLGYGATSDQIVGAVLCLNGPGGPEHAAYRVYDAIKNFKKPVTVYCEHGMLASSLYLVSLAADRVYASRPTDEIGSIGAYTTFRDYTPAQREGGAVVQEIYAPESPRKNIEYREAQKKNFKPIEAKMSRCAQAFIDLVRTHRPDVQAVDGIDPFQGDLVNAEQAVQMKLIDGISDMRDVVESTLLLVDNISYAYDSTFNQTPNDTMLGYLRLPALLAIKGLTPDKITSEHIAAIQAEFTALGLTGLAVVGATEFEQAATAANQVAELQTKLTEQMGLQTQLTTITGERDALQTRVAQLGTQPGAMPTNPPKTGEAQPSAESPDAQLTAEQILANLPHNRALDNNPAFN